MAKLNSALGIKSSYYGWYAQLPESGDWDGAQLLSQLDDVKASLSLALVTVFCLPLQGTGLQLHLPGERKLLLSMSAASGEAKRL